MSGIKIFLISEDITDYILKDFDSLLENVARLKRSKKHQKIIDSFFQYGLRQIYVTYFKQTDNFIIESLESHQLNIRLSTLKDELTNLSSEFAKLKL